jgi:quercetin dioxygenase-like cupin family protein
MKSLTVLTSALSLVAAYPNTTWPTADRNSIVVDEAPQSPRPYAIRKGSGRAVIVGSQIYSFPITGNSSGGAFTLLQTNAPDSAALGVFPHRHEFHYENFYCVKGRLQVWADTESTGTQARVLTAGDYGSIPHNAIHTFQVIDPDTQFTGVIQPGGFEELFLAISSGEFTSVVGSEFVPSASEQPGLVLNETVIKGLEHFDVYVEEDFVPRRDLINGSAGGSEPWHDGPNTLGANPVPPYFVARNYGPKFLNTDDGVYRLIAPLATGQQTGNNFSMGTITMSPLLPNQTATKISFSQPLAFQLEEGALVVEVDGYDATTLIQGDVVFVPAYTPFTYFAIAAFTKFLYVSGGGNGFDYHLLNRSISWDYATYPVNAGFTVQ